MGVPEEAKGSVWIALSTTGWVWFQPGQDSQLLERILAHHASSPALSNRLSEALIQAHGKFQSGEFAPLDQPIQSLLIEASFQGNRWILGFSYQRR